MVDEVAFTVICAGIVEVTMDAGCREEDTLAVYLSPESVDNLLWELEQLEGHQVVFSVEPGSTISEDKWLLDFIETLSGTTIDTDKIVRATAFPDLASVFRWEEGEFVHVVLSIAWSTFVTRRGVSEWTEVPATVIVCPSVETVLTHGAVSACVAGATSGGALATEFSIEPLS